MMKPRLGRCALILPLLAVLCLSSATIAQSNTSAEKNPGGAEADTRPATQAATGPATQPTTRPAARPPGADDGDGKSGIRELYERIASAREIGVILILLSVVGFASVIERFANLRRSAVVPEGLDQQVLRLMKAGRYDQAEALCRKSPSALSDVLVGVIKHRRMNFADVSVVAGDIATRDMEKHLRKAYPIAIVATLSPLLGLLGTVIGMIGSFEAVALAGSMGDPSIMAGDISYALTTTAMGLVIAVPSLGAYHYFRNKTTGLSAELDEQASDVISEWHLTLQDADGEG